MSLRLEMLQVARLAPTVLEDATDLVRNFVTSQLDASGGFINREGKPDLYYTVFGIDAMTALQMDLPVAKLEGYLSSFDNGESLDFVHRCCLARAWSALPKRGTGKINIPQLLQLIEAYRTPDGGYNQRSQSEFGSSYGCMLAYGAYSDHFQKMPCIEKLPACLDNLRTPDGAWSNDPEIPHGMATATAANITLLRNLGEPIPAELGEWLMRCADPQGGFRAFPAVPVPDLLSTAVVLHALDGLQFSYENVRDNCLGFIDSLWVATGGFYGHWADDTLDLEYTYYGLLGLGHLSF